jgi:hypothetical protein
LKHGSTNNSSLEQTLVGQAKNYIKMTPEMMRTFQDILLQNHPHANPAPQILSS